MTTSAADPVAMAGAATAKATATGASALALVRLLQWTSPTLPVGGFSYSQGLEAAVEGGLVDDPASAGRWIGDVLAGPVGSVEAVCLARFLQGWQQPEPARELALHALDRHYQATRESAQLLAETRQMGWSLLSLVHGLPPAGLGPAWPAIAQALQRLTARHPPSFLLVWAGLVHASGVPPGDAVAGWLWTWLENQVMAALKTVPLGQSAGQALLLTLAPQLPALAQQALQRAQATTGVAPSDLTDDGYPAWPDDGPGNYAPGFGLACAQHETQYSRLFRS